MGNAEENPQKTRRTTRSSCATPTKGTHEIIKQIDNLSSPSMSQNRFANESIRLDNLLSSFPGRCTQILEILHLIGPPDSPMVPLFLYGGTGTGKTSVILQVFRYLNRQVVYASCRSCYSPQILFESVLNQLLLHDKKASNDYANAKRCERFSDFVNLLRDALNQVINCNKESQKKKIVKEAKKEGRMIYLIFDNIELIQEWAKSSTLLPLLFSLDDHLKMCGLGLIFVSSNAPDMYYADTGFVEPLYVYFPDYTEDELYQIFMRNHANPKLYSSFLDAVLKPFCRITRRFDELSIALQPLYLTYSEHLSDSQGLLDENMKRKLFNDLLPLLTSSMKQVFSLSTWRKMENTGRACDGERLEDLEFHMSASAKYLLISSFLASRNPATLDAALFDSTGDSDNRKRKRKNTLVPPLKDDAAEQLLKGPGTFPLERLLAIYQCITSVVENSDIEKLPVTADDGSGLMSDALLQLSTLFVAGFITKGGSCPLEGSTRYRCLVSEDVAQKVAKSVNFPLRKYMHRG